MSPLTRSDDKTLRRTGHTGSAATNRAPHERTGAIVRDVTGWQGSGGWGPQQDPYGGQGGQQYGGGQYGADPYGGQYGADPYGQQQPQPQYGTDPYGQQQQPQYGTDPYGGQYGGYPGYQPGFEPPQPKRSKLPIILSIVAILAVVGTVVTIVLLNREDDPSPTANTGPTSSPSSRPSSPRENPASSRRQPPTSRSVPNAKPGWTTIELPGGSYQVPEDWRRDAQKRPSGLGVDFDRGAVVGNYQCEGNVYFRGFAAYGEAQSKDGSEIDPTKAVTDFGNSFAKEYYGNPTVEPGAPKETKVGSANGVTLTVKLTVTPTKPACEATSGEVAIIGVPIEEGGKTTAVRMLVVVNDLAGGPADPKSPPDDLAEEILTTFSVS